MKKLDYICGNLNFIENMAKKKNEECSLFEEMLMWTSYRYCIGRKSYVSCMSHEIPKAYYHRLSDERKQFVANDVRGEILDHLRWLPTGIKINRTYNTDELNPIKVLMEFFTRENIQSFDEFLTYRDLSYDSHKGEYTFTKCSPTIKSYYSPSDIGDLVDWETMASCFDIANHKTIRGEECFRTYTQKLVPMEGKSGYYRSLPFGWEPIWIPLNQYLAHGEHCSYYLESDVKDELEND